jgi:hypothetical protein
MTVTGDAPELDPPLPTPRAPVPAARFHEVCPYLQGEGGGWRSLQATRDHRCEATQPPIAVAVAKQRDLCLRPAHETCATFQAARALAHGDDPDPRAEAGLWPATQQAVLALGPARTTPGTLPAGAGRTAGQALLAALMAVAFLVIVVARAAPGSGAPGASLVAAAPSLEHVSLAPASLEPPTVAPSEPTASTSAGPSPSPAVSATPLAETRSPIPTSAPPASPASQAVYTVRAGDTLSSIAAAHGVTVRQLRRANDLAGNLIRPGQELVIP